MAITQNLYTGNGSTTNYSFTFPYLETTDIKVSLDGSDTTAYTLANATTIQFNTAPGSGVAIRIYRQTDDESLSAQFYPGSAIRSQDLNDNFTQNLYVTQETKRDVADAVAGQIPDGAISTSKLADGAVTDEKVTSIGSAKATFTQSGTGAVQRTVESKLQDVVSVLDFIPQSEHAAIKAGTSTYNATAAIQAAITAVGSSGGGAVFFPAGIYQLSNVNPGATSWDDKAGIRILHSNVTLQGSGVSTTKLRLVNNADCHVIKFGQRATATTVVENCGVYDLEIDGNRANQVTPDATNNHFQGIDVSSNCTGIKLERLYVHDIAYYGIGFQRTGFRDCSVQDVRIANTGADGIDFKGDNADNLNNRIEHVSVSNYGILTGLSTSSAGLDLRSGVVASSISVSSPGVDGLVGIRFQAGTVPGVLPIQGSEVSNFHVVGSSAANSVGVRIAQRNARASNGTILNWADGASISEPDTRVSDIYVANNTDAGIRLWQNAGAGWEADTTYLNGLVVRSNSAGIIYDSVDEVSAIGCEVRSNTGIGHDIRAGCTNIRIIGGSISGNGTNVSNGSTTTVIRDVSGYRTLTSKSTTVDIASTGTKSFSIAHTLPFTPAVDDCSLSLRRNTNVGDWSAGFLWVTSTDATNINGQLRVLTASATSGAVVDVLATIDSAGKL